ncbi:hypothetical protein ABMA08_25535 [Pseudomonas yamanorum]
MMIYLRHHPYQSANGARFGLRYRRRSPRFNCLAYGRPPACTMSYVTSAGVFPVSIDNHLLMVTLNSKEPWLTKKLQTVEHSRPAIYEITHPNDPVDSFIETELHQPFVEINRLEVNVTNDEIATDIVPGEPQDFLTHAGFLPQWPPTRLPKPYCPPDNSTFQQKYDQADDYAPLLWGKRSAQASRPEARGWKPKGP